MAGQHVRNGQVSPNGRGQRADRIARDLGWMSLGLGVAQVSAPGAVRRLSGVDDSERARAVVPLMGVRELTQAAGLLAGRRPGRWVWSRVIGDAMDLAMLGQTLRRQNLRRQAAMRQARQRSRRSETDRRRRTAMATAAVVGITAADLYAARRTAAGRWSTRDGALQLRASITVNTSPEEVYRFWRDFENLPQFMIHLESVEVTGERRSHWTAKAPAGRTVEWDAEITEDREGEVIAWRSLEGADVANSGAVRLTRAPGERGTEVRVDLEYLPPGGRLGAAVARLFGEHPEQQVRDDLRRFKQIVETGEVVRSEGSPEGPRARRQLKQRPAQPAAGPAEPVATGPGRHQDR